MNWRFWVVVLRVLRRGRAQLGILPDWDAGGVEGSIQGVISSPLGAFCFERSVVRSLFKLNFEKLAFGELDGSEIMDGEVIGVASTLW